MGKSRISDYQHYGQRRQLNRMYRTYNGVCQFCSARLSRNESTREHVPLANGGDRGDDNCKLACKQCNNMRNYITHAIARAITAQRDGKPIVSRNMKLMRRFEQCQVALHSCSGGVQRAKWHHETFIAWRTWTSRDGRVIGDPFAGYPIA